jgi:hypothetical protein
MFGESFDAAELKNKISGPLNRWGRGSENTGQNGAHPKLAQPLLLLNEQARNVFTKKNAIELKQRKIKGNIH